MRYCADTWFLLSLFYGEDKAKNVLTNTEFGKDFIFISNITYAETIRKLFQKGNSQYRIQNFFDLIKNTGKVSFISPDFKIAEESARLSLSYGLHLIDSFVASTAKLMDCDILLSDDSDFQPLIKKKYIKVQSW